MVSRELYEKLVQLRRNLHMNAELSGREKQTVSIINQFIHYYNPDKIISDIGKTGIAYIYKGIKKGPVLLLRADLDAVPFNESREIQWASLNAGASHKCGHDGHMAILAGVAALLSENKPACGSVVILFQPSEENGKGAFDVINDKNFSLIEPDYAVALHNVPGFNPGSLIIKEGVFSQASKGIRFLFQGIDSHASEPEKGISPVPAVTAFLEKFQKIVFKNSEAAICYVSIGEPSFGVCPGNAKVHITVRAGSSAAIQETAEDLTMIARKECEKYGITNKRDFHDEFPETRNNPELISVCLKTAKSLKIETVRPEMPFRWSEDFGYFTSDYKAALIGLGAGKNIPPLHHPNYDFPDEIIPKGIDFLNGLIRSILS